MELYHNSRATEYRTLTGRCPLGTALRLRLDVKIAEPGAGFSAAVDRTGDPCAMKRTTEGQYEAEILTRNSRGCCGTIFWWSFRGIPYALDGIPEVPAKLQKIRSHGR